MSKQNSIQENCIICNKLTPYTYDTPVNQRNNYIEAVGQLCACCSFEIYG